MTERTPEQVVADGPCVDPLGSIHGFCGAIGNRKHPECAIAALRAEGYAVVKVDEDSRERLQALVSEATWDLMKQTFLVEAILTALGLSEPVETRKGDQ